MATQPSGTAATPHILVSSANLLRVHSVPPSRSLVKWLNGTGPSIDPWGTPLVTGLLLDFVLLITIVWAQSLSQFSIHLCVCSSSLYTNSFSMNILQETVLEALSKSRYTIFAVLPSSVRPVISSQKFIKLVKHDHGAMLTTPDGFLVWMWLEMVSRISCAITFPVTEVRLIGL